MSDISPDQLDEFIRQIAKSAGSLNRLADNYDGKSSSSGGGVRVKNNAPNASSNLGGASKNIKEFNHGILNNIESLRDFTSGTRGFTSAIASLGKEMVGGFAIVEIAKWAHQTIDTYKDLTNYGQSFGGSMLQLSASAAAAGLPLDKFAAAIKNNSVFVKTLGIDGFAKLNKQVRTMSDQYGNYGYSLDQLTEITGSFGDILRLSGKNAKELSSPQTGKFINDFAMNMSAMSELTGKSREEIEKETKAALSDALVVSKMRDNTVSGMDSYNKAIMTAVSDLAAQPGQAGQTLSKALADTFSSLNGANLTKFGREVNSLGLGDISQSLDEANEKIKAGANQGDVTRELVAKLKKELNDPNVKESLRMQALAGKEGAAELLDMGANLKTYTKKEEEQAAALQKSKTTMTAFMSSFESVLAGLEGSLMEGFFKPFFGAGDKLDEGFFSQLDQLKPELTELGKSFGILVHSVLNPETLGALIGILKLLMDVAASSIPIIVKGFTWFGNGLKTVNDILNKAAGWIGGLVGKFDKPYGDYTTSFLKALSAVTTAVLGFALVMNAKKLLGNFLKPLFAPKQTAVMSVKAGVVNVNGAGGGGGNIGNDLANAVEGNGAVSAEKKAAKILKEEEQIRKAVAKGRKLGLAGEELEQFALNNRGGILGKTSRGIAKVGGGIASKVGGIAGRIPFLGKIGSGAAKFGPLIKGVGKFAGWTGAAITVASIAGNLMDIKNKVQAGQLSPEQAKHEVGKQLGGLAGTVGGAELGMLGGAALGTLIFPGVGTVVGGAIGGAIGAFGGEKAGNAVGAGLMDTFSGKPAGPVNQTTTQQPKTINEDDLAKVREGAYAGDNRSIELLKKLKDAIDHQTLVVDKGNKTNQRNSRDAINAIETYSGIS